MNRHGTIKLEATGSRWSGLPEFLRNLAEMHGLSNISMAVNKHFLTMTVIFKAEGDEPNLRAFKQDVQKQAE